MNKLPNELKFFIFLLEQYAARKETTGDKILRQWDALQLTEHIRNMYEQYHSEALENAFEDIDRLVSEALASSPRS